MSNTVEASGTQTATISTEHELASLSTAKTFVLHVDTAAMVAGDQLELRVYGTLLTGGTEHQAQSVTYSGAQTDPIKTSVPFPATGFGCRFTILQTAGTGRAFPYSVLSL